MYYSSYGHVEALADAVAQGARSTRATVAEFADYDAIVVGTPTRFGRMSIPDGGVSGSGWRSVDERRAEWQGWWRVAAKVKIDCQNFWRAHRTHRDAGREGHYARDAFSH